jgi:hypothetical protein
MAKAPVSEGDAPPGGADAATLAKFKEIDDSIDDIRNEVKNLSKGVSFVENTNRFVIIVLFAAFLVIVVAGGIAIISAIYTHTRPSLR